MFLYDTRLFYSEGLAQGETYSRLRQKLLVPLVSECLRHPNVLIHDKQENPRRKPPEAKSLSILVTLHEYQAPLIEFAPPSSED